MELCFFKEDVYKMLDQDIWIGKIASDICRKGSLYINRFWRKQDRLKYFRLQAICKPFGEIKNQHVLDDDFNLLLHQIRLFYVSKQRLRFPLFPIPICWKREDNDTLDFKLWERCVDTYLKKHKDHWNFFLRNLSKLAKVINEELDYLRDHNNHGVILIGYARDKGLF